ncbi:MAG: sulfatase [Hyphomicrobiaceae bacterium]
MTKILSLSLFALILFGPLRLAATAQFSDGANRTPNVLLIFVDDLNTSVGFLGGHPQVVTPHMDALAAESVVFTNAHSNVAICAPSRSSMLTGVYPHVSRNYWFDKWYENDVLKNCMPLPMFLRANGYRSIGTGKLMHDERKSDWTQFGLDHYFGPYAYDGKTLVGHPSVPRPFGGNDKNDGTYAPLSDIPTVPAHDEAPGYNGWYDHINKKQFRYVSDDDRDLLDDELQAAWTAERIRELAAEDDPKPFFLAVGFSRPHTPLIAPKKYFEMYPVESLVLPEILPGDREDCHLLSVFPKRQPRWVTMYDLLAESYADVSHGLRTYLQAYLACVTFVDDQVGTVMTALRESNLDDNTVVILVSDHGYHHGEKQFLFKSTLWEESTRIPLLVRAPKRGERIGQRVAVPVSMIDVYPTVADYCGLASRDNRLNENGSRLNGHSLRPLIEDPAAGEWEGPVCALTALRSPGSRKDPADQNFAVRSTNYRYIRYQTGKEELYHHPSDKHEWKNLADDPAHAEVKARLKTRMFDMVKELNDSGGPEHR